MAQADWASITCRGQQQTTLAAKPQALLQSLSQGTRAIRASFPRRALGRYRFSCGTFPRPRSEGRSCAGDAFWANPTEHATNHTL